MLNRRPMGKLSIAVPVAARKHLSAMDRFRSVIIHTGTGKSVVHLGSITHISLRTSSCGARDNVGKRGTTMLNVCVLPNTGTVRITSGIGRTVRRVDGGFPRKLDCRVPFSVAACVSRSVRRICGALFRTLMLIMLIMFLSLRD